MLTACNWFKQKTKDTINKSGEIVAKTGSEFVDGISKGVEKTFRNEVLFSDELRNSGLNAGKISISSSDSTTDNILTAYLIFNTGFEKNLTVKVFNESGQEHGKATQLVKGQKSEAHYIDFVFDKRTHVDSNGKITFE